MVPDSSDLEAALVGLLQNDPTLKGLLPDGVYFDVAPQSARQFAVVSLVDETDEDTYDGRAYEDGLYAVKAVEFSTVTTKNIKPAAARIDQLLIDALFTAPGYAEITVGREKRIRYTEVDDVDRSIRWSHRGAQYRVMGTLAPWTP
jgi:hypothetical protein